MRTFRVSTVLAALAAVAVMLLPGTPAWAHNQLLSSDPERDATLKKAPASVTLTFAQKLNPDFTTVVLTDAAKKRVPTSDPAIKAAKASVEVTDALANGEYTVAYRVVSVDGHVVQGSYGFTVDNPVAASAPSLPAPSSAAASSTSGSAAASPVPVDLAASESAAGVSPATLIGIGAAAVLVAAIGAFVVLRNRRS